MTLREFFRTLWRGKVEVLAAVGIVLAGAVLYLSQQGTTYEATAEVRLASAEVAIGSAELVEVTVPVDPAQLRSEPVVARAAEILGEDPEGLARGVSAALDDQTVVVTAAADQWDRATTVADAFAVAYADWLGHDRAEQVSYYGARRDVLAQTLTTLGPMDAGDGARDPLASAEQELIVTEYTTLTVELRTLEAVPEPVAVAEPTSEVAELAPPWRTTLAAAALAGLLAGLGLAFARRGLDVRVRSGAAAADLAQASVLAELRNVRRSLRDFRRARALPVTSRTATPFTESIRELRTAIEVAVTGVERPVVVITAADNYEGRAFITANVAASFGLSGVAVTAVVGDLRRPQLAQLLQPRAEEEERPGLQVTQVPNVSLRHLPDSELDPADLLASTGIRDLVEETRGQAQITIIDAPPVLAAADATILGRYATVTVLVVAAGATNRSALAQSAERLRTNGVTLAGVALAEVKVERGRGYATTYGDDSPADSEEQDPPAIPPGPHTSRRSQRAGSRTVTGSSGPDVPMAAASAQRPQGESSA